MQVLLAGIRNCIFSMQKRGEHLMYLTSVCMEKMRFMFFISCACIIQRLLLLATDVSNDSNLFIIRYFVIRQYIQSRDGVTNKT